MEEWPSTLPQCPLVGGFKTRRRSGSVEFQTDTGPAKVRRVTTATPTDVDESYNLTQAQANTLENFYETTLRSGVKEFLKKNPRTGQNSVYRIVEPPELNTAGIYFTTTLKLEIQP